MRVLKNACGIIEAITIVAVVVVEVVAAAETLGFLYVLVSFYLEI